MGYNFPKTKKHGFDLTHTKMALSQLAIVHAVGRAYFLSRNEGNFEKTAKEEQLLFRDWFISNPDEIIAPVLHGISEEWTYVS